MYFLTGKMNTALVFLAVLFVGAIVSPTVCDLAEDRRALLDFLNNITHSRAINWNSNNLVCTSWTGVRCNNDRSRVIALRLPGMSLSGPIPPNTLSRLKHIQILSLHSNALSATFPSDFAKLLSLTGIYLQFNRFTGTLPDFSVWKNLSVVDFSSNGFNGSIPSSVFNLTRLQTLNLDKNMLSGEIPDYNPPTLNHLNLANNRLTGMVPKSFQRFPNSAFANNNFTFQTALPPALAPQPPIPQPERKKHFKLSEPAILGIAIGGCVLGFVIIALLIILFYSKKKVDKEYSGNVKKTDSLKNKSSDDEENKKLVFFEGCKLAFNLEDLLRASAEVLGKGMFGTTYKAALEDTTTVVVKRLKEVSVAKRDFEQQMEIAGNIRHENVAALRAYFHSKDEKLMVYDYYEEGSVAALLNGSRENRVPFYWETRLKIAVDTARGIAYIHTQNSGKFVHGNIKSSNIFLNSNGTSCVSDTGLATLVNPFSPPVTRPSGYRAPEVTDTRKSTRASDVYSFGVFLLELITGQSPTAFPKERTTSLVRWVNSVVREEWTGEAFDVQLLKYAHVEEEMVDMLQIGLSCTARMPNQRPDMVDVVKMVEGIRRNQAPSEDKSEGSSSSTPTPLERKAGPSSIQ